MNEKEVDYRKPVLLLKQIEKAHRKIIDQAQMAKVHADAKLRYDAAVQGLQE